MTFIVATNVIASRPPERRPTGTPTDWNAARSCQFLKMRRKETEICQTFIIVLKGGGEVPPVWQKTKLLLFFFMKASVSEIWILNTSSSSYWDQQFQSSQSPVQLELSTALILIISTPTPTHPPTPTNPPTHPRDSSNETLLDFLGRWNMVWKIYSSKLGKLGN